MVLISERYVNRTEGYTWGESDVIEAFTEDMGKLFSGCQREYGRCIGKAYVDCPSGKTKAVGWVFEKLAHYEDTDEPFIQETWVTLYDLAPTKITTYHHHDIEA